MRVILNDCMVMLYKILPNASKSAESSDLSKLLLLILPQWCNNVYSFVSRESNDNI